MLKKRKNYLDGKTYERSLRSGSATHRFYDQLRAHSRTYSESWAKRMVTGLKCKLRKRRKMRTVKRIEKRKCL